MPSRCLGQCGSKPPPRTAHPVAREASLRKPFGEAPSRGQPNGPDRRGLREPEPSGLGRCGGARGARHQARVPQARARGVLGAAGALPGEADPPLQVAGFEPRLSTLTGWFSSHHFRPLPAGFDRPLTRSRAPPSPTGWRWALARWSY